MKTKFFKPNTFILFACFIAFYVNVRSQTYKIGDSHPCGGIVFSVDAAGKNGVVAAPADIGKYNFADAGKAIQEKLGAGWTIPNQDQLNQMYLNLYKKGLGNFKPEKYRTGQESGYPMYPWAQNFANGKQEGDGRNNLTLIRPIKAFPCLEATSKLPEYTDMPQLFPFGTEGQRKDSEVGAGKEVNLEVIFVDWADQPATSNDFDGLWKSITSDGALIKALQAHGVKVNVNLHKTGWKRMPKNISHYFLPSTAAGDWKWQDYTQHSVELLGQGANYPANTIAIIVPSSKVPGFKSGVPSGAHGAGFRGIRKMVTLVPQVYNEHYTTLMHEIGHCFGADELYPASTPYLHEVGGYDVMGDIVYATGFIGWHRFRYGWMDLQRIQFLPQKGNYNVALKKISSASGKSMVVVPDPNKPLKYWVIEIGQDVMSRQQFKAGKGEKLNTEGDRLIVYTIEYPEVSGKRAIRLVPRTQFVGEHGTVEWLDKVSYKANQSSEKTDMPFTLSVDNKVPDGFSITINVKTDIPYLTFPKDQVSKNGQYKLAFQTDGNLGISRTANNGYVWDAKNNLFAGKSFNNNWIALRNGNIQLVDAQTGKTLGEKIVSAPSGSQFNVSDDGKLLIVDGIGKEVWRNN